MSTEEETLLVSVLPYRCLKYPTLVTRQTSNLAILADSKIQNASLFHVHAMFRHDCPLAVKPASTPRSLVHTKKKLGEILYLLICYFSPVSVLVVAQQSSEVPEGLMNYPLCKIHPVYFFKLWDKMHKMFCIIFRNLCFNFHAH